jgi:hypothetical protein
VSRVFLHCSADNSAKNDSVFVMDAWHKARGWSGCGYHYFIRQDGVIQVGRDVEKVPAAQEGNNTGTIAISMHGLYVKDFTQAQRDALIRLCALIDAAYAPAHLTYHGHIEVANKACPVYDYRALLGLDELGRRAYTPLREFSPRAATRKWPGLLDPMTAKIVASPAVPKPVEIPPAPKGAKDYTPAGRRTLKRGVPRGEDVKYVQRIVGISPPEADGIFGPDTERHVKAFQKHVNLPMTGIVGEAEWDAFTVR